MRYLILFFGAIIAIQLLAIILSLIVVGVKFFLLLGLLAFLLILFGVNKLYGDRK